jgi:NAD(P)-dependent dehydrogenase (short-subunit alcohol dehydrogenase family)
MPKVVLITGCSSGIGRCLAERLTQTGYIVVATARRVETMLDLPAALKLPLDVTRPDLVDQAITCTLQQFGRIDILINNAGYTMLGALEDVSDEQTRQVFDVNVFGALRMIRAVVPHMRRQHSGRIINISSIAGKLATPANGTYTATKFALEALSDALRLELEPFGIQVIAIEPGAIRSNFDDTAQAHAKSILTNANSPYLKLYQQNEKFSKEMRKHEPGPEAVCKVIEQALAVPHPKPRYLVAMSFSGRLVILFRDLLWDSVARQMFKVNRTEI